MHNSYAQVHADTHYYAPMPPNTHEHTRARALVYTTTDHALNISNTP